MKYIYTGKGMEVTDTLKARVEKKLGKFERYFRDEPEVTVRFKLQKGARNIVEITVVVGGLILYSCKNCEQEVLCLYASINRGISPCFSLLFSVCLVYYTCFIETCQFFIAGLYWLLKFFIDAPFILFPTFVFLIHGLTAAHCRSTPLPV